MKLDFNILKQAIQRQFNAMKDKHIFQVDIDRDEIWKLYLSSFPDGTNPRFRERTEYDCSCCRSFIKNAGGMVTIVDNKLQSLWDIQVEGYQPVVDALSSYVKSKTISNVFLYPDKTIGTDKNLERVDVNFIVTWEHFYLTLPTNLFCVKDSIGTKQSEFRALHDVVLRSLLEITPDAITTVQDLISQNSLYRGAEKKDIVDRFATVKEEFDKLTVDKHDIYAWSLVIGPNAYIYRMKNDVIGTLLVDLSEGKDLESSVKSFEDKVSGSNYKRPTSLITPRMRDLAKSKLQEMGLTESLERRYAKLEDIDIENVIFANRDTKKRITGDVFDQIAVKTQTEKTLGKIEEISIDKFIEDVVPNITSMEILVENKHRSNLVSLIAPQDLTGKCLFKWSNPFSWSYNGDVADSIKERVKTAGGNVTGDVCCRLSWWNFDDLDLHIQEPSFHIFYRAKHSLKSGGTLDVDMNVSRLVKDPVENIVYQHWSSMPIGRYTLSVNQYTKRESIDVGFEIEIDIMGNISNFSYAKAFTQKETIDVAALYVTRTGVNVIPLMESSSPVKEIWGISTQNFHPVNALTLSPNFWDKKEIGNKHFLFFIDGCRNNGSARGFYNEFLNSNLEEYRKTMEIVGAKMRTEESNDQLSGLGFSSTQRNSVVVKVYGSFTRTLKIIF